MNENTKFAKGHTKVGGGKKGTPNKRTEDIVERLKGIDIVGELLEIANTTQKEDTKVTVYKELMKYVYPQRKAIDVNSDMSNFAVYINRQAVSAKNDSITSDL